VKGKKFLEKLAEPWLKHPYVVNGLTLIIGVMILFTAIDDPEILGKNMDILVAMFFAVLFIVGSVANIYLAIRYRSAH